MGQNHILNLSMNTFRFAVSRLHCGIRLLTVMLISVVTGAVSTAQPITNNAILVVFDFDADGTSDATYEQIGFKSRTNPDYYVCEVFLRNTSTLRFLRGANKRIDFAANQVVSELSPVHVSASGGNYVSLLDYDAQFINFVEWRFIDLGLAPPENFYTNKTEVLIGFRLTSLDLGTKHHGWLKLNRPDTRITTPFAVAGYDWNPLPDQPIAAGDPPVIPVQSALNEVGQLRLQWPAGVSSWVPESSPTLGPDAVWEPVPDVVGTEVVLALPETNRFFRLRRP